MATVSDSPSGSEGKVVNGEVSSPSRMARRYPLKIWELEIPAPGWAISLACVILLAVLSIWSYYQFVAPNLADGNPVGRVLSSLMDDSVSATVFLLGLALLFAAVFFAHHALRADKSAPIWLKVCLFVAFFGSVTALVASPCMRLHSLRKLAPANHLDVLKNLKDNARVHYVIRLIPYTQASKDYLSIAKLSNLGRCCDPSSSDKANQECLKDPVPQRCTQQQFVFVADYAELRGLKVREAVERIGLSLDRAVGVSAIVFPLDDRRLFPASARGVLQVVHQVDHDHASDPGYKPLEFDTVNPQQELADVSIASYNWSRASATYPQHCRLAEQFRCASQFGRPYSAASRIGSLSRDWHPLGLARQTLEDPCRPALDHCVISKWSDVGDQQIREHQIARVFLIDNFPLSALEGRYMIDYDNPTVQSIVDIGESAGTR